jgi:hypothetical protein
MAALPGGYHDTNVHKPGDGSATGGATLLPPGVSHFQVVESDGKPAKSGKGYVIGLTLEVIAGDYVGSRVFWSINYQHTNPKVEAIGKREWSDLCAAIGIAGTMDTNEVHYKPFYARHDVEPASPNPAGGMFSERTRVRGALHGKGLAEFLAASGGGQAPQVHPNHPASSHQPPQTYQQQAYAPPQAFQPPPQQSVQQAAQQAGAAYTPPMAPPQTFQPPGAPPQGFQPPPAGQIYPPPTPSGSMPWER